MRQTFAQETWGWMVHGVCSALLVLLFAGSAFAAETWVEEIWKMVAFEKAAYPQSNFDPYFAKLASIRKAVEGKDQLFVKKEVDRFLKMLASRAYGIHDVAADEIYNFVLVVRPTDDSASTAASEVRIGGEHATNVSGHSMSAHQEGSRPCELGGGCDYWRDDVFDPGAS